MNTISCVKPCYDYSKLRGRNKEVLGTEGELAKRIGRTHAFLSSVFNGTSYFTPTDMDNIAAELEIDLPDYGEYFFKKQVLK